MAEHSHQFWVGKGEGFSLATSSSIRVLLVDDFEPFRRFLRSALEKSLPGQHFYEATDGLEAVRKAQELQPDLVLLDVGLPTIHGIEAARRIRVLCPNSKILFVSQQSSPDIIEAALNTGAYGYIVKADVARDLLPAVRAVLRGDAFAGPRFWGASPGRETSPHEAGFYSDDASCVDSFAQFLAGALNCGTAALFVGTESYRNSVSAAVHARGIDVAAAIKDGRYLSLDVADVLSTFMVDGLPDGNRFLKTAGELISLAAKTVTGDHAAVAACGQSAALLWAQGNAEAAIRLEQLWNEAVSKYNVQMLCGYPVTGFQGGVGNHVFEKICAEHSAVHSR